MSGATTELSLATAVDGDDNADYLTINLANSLRTVDALFNAVSGHTHVGSHQGGPVGPPATGSITSAQIADGTIQTADLADNSVTSLKIVDGTIQTADIAVAATTNLIGIYQAIPTFSSTSTGAYTPTPVTVTGSASGVAGAQVLVFCTFTWSHSAAAGAFIYASVLVDGSSVGGLGVGMIGVTGQTITTHVQFQHVPAAGSHTWTLALYNNTAGTVALNNAVSSNMFVLDIKR